MEFLAGIPFGATAAGHAIMLVASVGVRGFSSWYRERQMRKNTQAEQQRTLDFLLKNRPDVLREAAEQSKTSAT